MTEMPAKQQKVRQYIHRNAKEAEEYLDFQVSAAE